MRQLWLPKVKLGVAVVKKYPQPKQVKLFAPKKFELLHHPFDLGFRGRIGKWLDRMLEVGSQRPEGKGGKLGVRNKITEKCLGECDWRVMELYFFPQGGRKKWLNQDEILGKVKIGSKKKLRRVLVEGLVGVWEKGKTFIF